MAKKFGKEAHAISIAIPKDHKNSMDRYEIEEAARTMKKHQEIKANPKLHNAAKKHLMREKVMAERAIKGK